MSHITIIIEKEVLIMGEQRTDLVSFGMEQL